MTIAELHSRLLWDFRLLGFLGMVNTIVLIILITRYKK